MRGPARPNPVAPRASVGPHPLRRRSRRFGWNLRPPGTRCRRLRRPHRTSGVGLLGHEVVRGSPWMRLYPVIRDAIHLEVAIRLGTWLAGYLRVMEPTQNTTVAELSDEQLLDAYKRAAVDR